MSELKVAYYGAHGHQIGWPVGATKRAKLVGVADFPEKKFAKLSEEMPEAYRDAVQYKDLDELLERSGAELISICSARRDEQHKDIIKALEAGMHVYAEKPLATTMKNLEAIRAAAEKTGKEIRSMTGLIYSSAFGEMQKLVEEGKLGTLVQVFAQKSYPYHDRRPQDRGADGGLIEQTSVHAVGFVRFVTGLEFEEVYAMDTGRGNPKEGDLQMAAQYVARMSGGALCTVLCNYCNPPGIGFWGNDQLRVHGTDGMVESVDGGTRTMLAIGKEEPVPLAVKEKPQGRDLLFEDYVNHLLDGSEMLLSQEDSLMNTQVVIRAQESASSGKVVKV